MLNHNFWLIQVKIGQNVGFLRSNLVNMSRFRFLELKLVNIGQNFGLNVEISSHFGD